MRPAPLRDLPRDVVALVAVAFAVAVGFGIVVPALPIFAREFGVGRTGAAAVISAFALMRFVSAFFGGWLVDRMGERLVLAVGIGVVAVSSALAGVAQSYGQLLVLRGIGGVGSAMFTVSALSLLLRSVDSTQRGKATGLFHGGFLIGGIAGPTLGALVIDFSLRLPFFLYAGTLTVAGALGLSMLSRPSGDGAVEERPERVGLREALGNQAFRAAMVTNLADMWAVFGVRSALIPLFVVEGLDEGPIWIGVGLAVVAAVNGAVLFPAGMLADRWGRKPVMFTGCLIGAAALVTLGVFDTLPGYLVAMVVFGIGSGMLNVTPAAVVGDVVGGGGGKPVAAFQMAGDFGTIVGPIAAGFIADETSFGLAFAATGGIFLVAAAMVAAAPETLRSSGPESSREVSKKVVDVLDAHGQPNKIARDLEG